jgi:hypothetical protein
MEEMKWSSNGLLGVLTAHTILVLALHWLKSAKLVANNMSQEAMTCPKSATWSLHRVENITHWTPMEEMINGTAIVFMRNWLQTTLVLALHWPKSAKLFASDGAKRTGHDMSKTSHTEPLYL